MPSKVASVAMPSAAPFKVERLSFLLGDWRGVGVMTFNGATPAVVEYECRQMCKLTPDGSRLEFVEFDDNPKTERMFHGEHSFIYVDSTSGELRLRRHTFLDSEDRGFLVMEERVEVAEDGKSMTLRSIGGTGVSPLHEGTIQRVGDSELLEKGRIIMGDRIDPYEVRLVRRSVKQVKRRVESGKAFAPRGGQ